MDEFESIARLFRPLAGEPEALGLKDDAALLPMRAGHELVVTADALVEGVHFLPDDPPDLVARKLLRVNLSDLAAKTAEPYGYILTVAWSPAWGEERRTAFARGLGEDHAAFGLRLFGGDTVSTPGPMTASVTMMGWVPEGRMVRRSGARAGDVLLVSGTIGDGYLGLKAARGELDLAQADLDYLADRYRLPQPRLALRGALRRYATAAADVSDGLLADAGHIAEASRLGVEVELDQVPTTRFPLLSSSPAEAGDPSDAGNAAERGLGRPIKSGDDGMGVERLLELATGGDDYEIVCTASPENAHHLIEAGFAAIGRVVEGEGIAATVNGKPVETRRMGWRHG